MEQQHYYRDSWVEINLDAIKYNINQIKRRLPNDKKIFAVVKANAYGHGDVQIAQVALKEGVYGLAVALLDEAIKLRKAGIKAPILVLGYVRPEASGIAASHQITLTVFQKEWLQKAQGNLNEEKLSIHIKVDTGMGRIGIKTPNELETLMKEISEDHYQIDGLFTHFATADEADLTYYNQQRSGFKELIKVFRQHTNQAIIHADNSAASMRFPEETNDAVRFGISMYGLYPSDFVKEENPIDIKPVFSLHSQLVHVKKVEKGESISYGRTFIASEDIWVGTIPLGYADGWIRKLQGSDVLVEGKRVPIVGRICMDQFMVQLDKPYDIGTKVTLIGKQKDEEITVDEVAQRLETINYEIPCMISARVPRVYKNNNQIIHIENLVLK